MADVIPVPTAVMVGATHVSVAQVSSGRWAVMVWKRDTGPQMLRTPVSYGKAAARAKAYADEVGAILDLPDDFGAIHMRRLDDGRYEVLHEGRSGENFSSLGTFGANDRDEAIGHALSMLAQFSPCRMGRVEL